MARPTVAGVCNKTSVSFKASFELLHPIFMESKACFGRFKVGFTTQKDLGI